MDLKDLGAPTVDAVRHFLRLVQRWVYALFLSLDLLLSALAFGAPGETISARLARDKGLDRYACRALDALVRALFGQQKHCEAALEAFNARERVASFWSG